ncbi:uncharacterized protein K460DRAFT_10571 [Cucurbitaria berberidis CBS 394.84]|uniref:Uncharacterized protein n=1 Tax=Cucurbitaria berberidis CBS 394.84 TaxID=1168544 RepID=A0A9P4GRN6_9PLEO|nr:uncharacterized protein K460DRAFT_10571 [Cucurbitaria berberidis CBS 394.84]KAF1850092.1 hypothetical protein K460DRAFT_10571 [Cucurbitaria berberidis CBS 394.84]
MYPSGSSHLKTHVYVPESRSADLKTIYISMSPKTFDSTDVPFDVRCGDALVHHDFHRSYRSVRAFSLLIIAQDLIDSSYIAILVILPLPK